MGWSLARQGFLILVRLVLILALVAVALLAWKRTPMLTTALERLLVYFPERRLGIKPDAFGWDYRDLSLSTPDGITLHGWFLSDPAARWTCLYLHGNAGNIADRLDQVRILKQAGCQTVLFDYRGYGLSTGLPEEQGLYRDAETVYRWMTDREKIDPGRIALFGESLGGAVAIELAARLPVGALMVESTFTSLRDLARQVYPWAPFHLLAGHRYPSLERIARIQGPKLIIHGTRDEVIPFQMGEALFRAAPEPKRFFPVPGAHHNDVSQVGGQEYANCLAVFLNP